MTKTRIRHPKPQRANEAWHIELARIGHGRQMSVFCVIDLFSRECLAAEVKSRFSGSDTVRVLDRLASQRGAPKYLMPGRSTLFYEAKVPSWAAASGIRVEYDAYAEAVVEQLVRLLDINGAHNVAPTVDIWNRSRKNKR